MGYMLVFALFIAFLFWISETPGPGGPTRYA